MMVKLLGKICIRIIMVNYMLPYGENKNTIMSKGKIYIRNKVVKLHDKICGRIVMVKLHVTRRQKWKYRVVLMQNMH